ncbi:MAG: UvrD-helicase domain-containing protein [Spirochaetaceae bacterium]|jgi:ATP-dependent helicase/nuclease subunit A|nr:UvrD-helicase domain-containing protein [Spirochaetaceae bacterium]
MAIEEILRGLNAEQLEAVKTLSNVVVSAGAGSGKTKVLASRFAYLVIEKGLKVDEILTLTFTNKATNEMYSRIYRLLSGENDPASRAAVKDFHKAKISTLDSFCAEICALGCTRYGIKNDFITDESAVYDMANEAALSFVLDNRSAPGIQALITDNKIRDIARYLFAEIVTKYGSITNPLPFDTYIEKQRNELVKEWRRYSSLAVEAVYAVQNELPGVKNKTKTYNKFCAAFLGLDAAAPEIEPLLEASVSAAIKDERRSALCAFIDALSGIGKLQKAGKTGGLEIVREIHDNFKDNIYPQIVKIAAMILNFDTVRGVFSLLDIFQHDFNNKKRIAGMMTFNDAAELALTILKNEPDIRNIYAEKIKAVMIDEFQDNNDLQRELLFLTGDCPIFFVGDQKQSIYRFRGADVSVFKKLGNDIEKNIRLKVNYRSNSHLIQAFNHIFSGVFPGKSKDAPDYEAEYEPLEAPGGNAPPPAEAVRICLFDNNAAPEDADAADIEAAFIAEEIRRMVDGAYQIRGRDGKNRACAYRDFAVLERSVTHQHNLEKQLRAFGVPHNSENCSGLFTDAPANDIYNFLRLLVYPKDKSAYAAVLRSPFARLSDITLTVCMLKFTGIPFDPDLEEQLPVEERHLYARARNIYRELLRRIREQNFSSAELITKLWYDYGYRYDTLWSAEAQVYGEIYDYLFELARVNDARGKTLAGFIDYLDAIALKKEKLQDFDLPLERRQGVKIMTIHKSKGLEFPIVFIYGSGAHGQNVKNSGLAAFSREWGVSLNLNPVENFPERKTGNYFFDLTRETEKLKEEAELRRLLYVAMTRAEDTLVLTGVKNSKNTGVKSFLDLLETTLSDSDNGKTLFSVREIEPKTRAEIREAAARYNTEVSRAKKTSMREKAFRAGEKYALAAAVPPPEIFITRRQASRLGEDGFARNRPELAAGAGSSGENGYRFFDDMALTPAAFGTLVHRVIEERYNGESGETSLYWKDEGGGEDEGKKLAARFADSFFASELGKKSLQAAFRKTEYPFLCLQEEGGKKVYVSGVIDLLFEFENEIYVVDYKTDTVVNPEKYREQLAVYARAAAGIFGKKTRAFIFYLRQGDLIAL